MAGYSGTPLGTNLGLAAGMTAELVHAPTGWVVAGAPTGIRCLTGETDAAASVIVSFYREPAHFLGELPGLPARITLVSPVRNR
jgi:hypothetical protein